MCPVSLVQCKTGDLIAMVLQHSSFSVTEVLSAYFWHYTCYNTQQTTTVKFKKSCHHSKPQA